MSTTTAPLPQVTVEALEVHADRLDVARAAAIYREYGALVVRGLMKPYVEAIRRDVEVVAQQALALVDQAKAVPEGWHTPDGALWLPAPAGFARDKQLMLLPCGYRHSAAFFRSALDPKQLALIEAILGPQVELFGDGQVLYKEPVGGHPKMLHQDASYFEHKFEGPCANLSYAVDTDLNNGALHIVPGSHKFGVLRHVDTFSHLGLDPSIWTWEKALPVCGQAGDSIFFHVNTIHGSKENFSKAPRPVFITRFRRADDYVVIGATSVKNRAEAEKHAANAKKENQLGLMVLGHRGYQADRATK